MSIIRRLWNPKGPAKRPGQSDEERDNQLAAAEAKRERKRAKARKLLESGQVPLNPAPLWKPWHEAAKDLGMEGMVQGVDMAHQSDREELYEPAKLEEKQ